MSPGSKYDDGFGPPIDGDDFHDDQDFPSPEDETSHGDSEQYIKDGNDFILKQFDAKNISRQYSNSQALKSTKASASAMTLDGVDWSGFSGKAHKKGKLKPGSSKRLHTAKHDEILEVKSKVSSIDGHEVKPCSEAALSSRSSRRRHSPGKFQSRRASARQLLNLSEDLSASLHDLKTNAKERRARASSRERRPRQPAGDTLDGSNHTGSARRSRRTMRSRAHSADLKHREVTEDGQLNDGTGSGHRPRRHHSKRTKAVDPEGLVSPSGQTRSPVNRVTRAERGLGAQKPRRQSSLVQSKPEDGERRPGSPRSPGSRKSGVDRERSHRPKKHNSTGVLGVRSSRRFEKNRSVSPAAGDRSRRGDSKSPGRGWAAASATAFEVSRPKAIRTRRASKDRGAGLIKSKGSMEW